MSADGVAHVKEQTIQLQEQKLAALHDKLRRAEEAGGSTSRALEAANARVAEIERTNSELGQQLLQAIAKRDGCSIRYIAVTSPWHRRYIAVAPCHRDVAVTSLLHRRNIAVAPP